MKISEHYRRLLAAGFLTLTLMLTATAMRAQGAGNILKINFTDGSQTLIALTEDLRMDFDNEHLLILQNLENPRILHLMDIANLSYVIDTSGVTGIITDTQPVINITADGISVSRDGAHSCNVYDLDGRVLLNQKFVDSILIESQSLPSGTVILQIDQNKTFKFLIK